MWEDPWNICAIMLPSNAVTQKVKRPSLFSTFDSSRELATSNLWKKKKIKVTKMQCVIKAGNSSLHTISGAKDIEGENTHRLLLRTLAYTAIPTVGRSLYIALVSILSLLSLQLETHPSIGDCWLHLTGLLLTRLTYIKCAYLNILNDVNTLYRMEFVSHCIWVLCKTGHFMSACTGIIPHLRRWAEILFWFYTENTIGFLRAH